MPPVGQLRVLSPQPGSPDAPMEELSTSEQVDRLDMSTFGPALPADDTAPVNEGQPSAEDISSLVALMLDRSSAAENSSEICDSSSQSFKDSVSLVKEMAQGLQVDFDNLTAEGKGDFDIDGIQDMITQSMVAINRLEQSQDRLDKCKMAVISAETAARARRQLELRRMLSGSKLKQSEASMEIKVRNAEKFELEFAYHNMKAALEEASQERELCFQALTEGEGGQQPAHLNPTIFAEGKWNRRRSL